MSDFDKTIHQIYDCRQGFILIGLTGRTGSGCTTAASILSSEVENLDLPEPTMKGINLNEERKYKIVYNFTKKNWTKFKWIQIKNIITSLILDIHIDEFVEFISDELYNEHITKHEIKERFIAECGDE
jgi:hypothetical protein